MRHVASGLLMLSMTGCAFIDQQLRVEPHLTVVPSNIGEGKQVALRVIDDRQEQLIGKRGYHSGTYGGVYGGLTGGAKISTDQDLAEVIRAVVRDGLRQKGFEPVDDNRADRSLKVELRALAYDTSVGLMTGGNLGKASVKVLASRSGATYEKTYHSQQEIRTFFVASQETNAHVINAALSEALDKLFADADLWNFFIQ